MFKEAGNLAICMRTDFQYSINEPVALLRTRIVLKRSSPPLKYKPVKVSNHTLPPARQQETSESITLALSDFLKFPPNTTINNNVDLQSKNRLTSSEILESYESPSAFYNRTGRSYVYRAIRTLGIYKEGTGTPNSFPPDGDVFPELKDQHLKRAEKYKSMTHWVGGDIVSTGPELKLPPLQHVSGDNQQSQYISTGTSGAAAYNTMYNWNSSGMGKDRRERPSKYWDPIIEIDVQKLDPQIKIYDMQRDVFKDPDLPQIGQLADADGEVLISNKINASAISRIITDHVQLKAFLEAYLKPADTPAPPLASKPELYNFTIKEKTLTPMSEDSSPVAFKKRKFSGNRNIRQQ